MKKGFFILMLVLLASCGSDSDSTSNNDDSETSKKCSDECRVFITDATFNGNLGGISGADQKCANDANHPKDGSVFKAMVVGDTRRACSTGGCTGGASEGQNWVLKPNQKYVYMNTGNEFLVTNANAVTDFIMFTDLAEMDKALYKVWTGLDHDSAGFIASSNWLNSSDNCSSWSDENALGGMYGESDGETADGTNIIIKTMAEACNNTNPIYCVEQ